MSNMTFADLINRPPRTIRWYPIPETVQKFTGTSYKWVGIQELLLSEEKGVFETNDAAAGVAANLLERAFVGVDRVVSTEQSGDRIRLFAGFPPKLRALVQSAFTAVHYPSNDETKSFLDGVEIEVA